MVPEHANHLPWPAIRSYEGRNCESTQQNPPAQWDLSKKRLACWWWITLHGSWTQDIWNKVYTPLKINVEPENDGLEGDFPLQGVYSQVPCQSSGVQWLNDMTVFHFETPSQNPWKWWLWMGKQWIQFLNTVVPEFNSLFVELYHTHTPEVST